MKDPAERVAAFVDGLLKGRRPPRFPADADEAATLRAAAALAAARPGADAPSQRFVDQLQRRLADAVETRSQPSAVRRRLLGRLGLPAAAAVFGAAAATGVRRALPPLPAREPQAELVPAGASAGWVQVASLASLTPGRPLRFTAAAIQGFLVRSAGGEAVFGLSAVCTHMGCLLNPNPEAGRLDCPCHGASFSMDGAPLSPEYTRPLPRLRVRVNYGVVEVYAG